jgi:hypothetical protein
MSKLSELDAARKELMAELASVDRQRQEALLLDANAGIPMVGDGVDEEDQDPPEFIPEGGTTADKTLSAAVLLSGQLFAATKSMNQCFKRNAAHMEKASATLEAVAKPARKKTRWDTPESSEKEDGKEAKPSPFAYVVGENPEAATDSMGNKHFFFIHIYTIL